MTLHYPFQIGPDLRPALRVADAWISVESAGNGEFRFFVSRKAWANPVTGGELRPSPLAKDPLREAFETLLAFLADDPGIFDAPLQGWAQDFAGELAMALSDVEDSTGFSE